MKIKFYLSCLSIDYAKFFFIALVAIHFSCKEESTDIGLLELPSGFSTQTVDGIEFSFYAPPSYDKGKKSKILVGVSPGISPGYTGEQLSRLFKDFSDSQNIIIACPIELYSDIDKLKTALVNHMEIHADSVYLGGYSRGGNTALARLYISPGSFKGFLGVAPAIAGTTYNFDNGKNIPTAIVVGSRDNFLSGINTFANTLSGMNGKILVITIPEVDHDGIFTIPNTSSFIEAFEFIK